MTNLGNVLHQTENNGADKLTSFKRKFAKEMGIIALIGVVTLPVTVPLIALGVVSYPNGPVDLWGDYGKELSEGDTKQLVVEAQHSRFLEDMPDKERFILQYIGSTGNGQTINVTDAAIENSNGVLGFIHEMHSDNYFTALSEYGETCLAGSAYDVTQSEIRGFSNGNINAIARIVPEGSGIAVFPAGSETDALRMTVAEDGFLIPTDEFTRQTLEINSCDAEIKM